MGRKCTICEHAKRKEIDKALVEPNADLRLIALRFSVSKYALTRHFNKGHIAAKIAKLGHAKEAVEADDFLTHLSKKRTRFKEMAEDAKTKDNAYLELKVYQVEGKFLELEGKALGVFKAEKGSPGNPPAAALIAPLSPEAARKIGDIVAGNL
jgi:hypothetical protein